jgi:hypothetical protein
MHNPFKLFFYLVGIEYFLTLQQNKLGIARLNKLNGIQHNKLNGIQHEKLEFD